MSTLYPLPDLDLPQLSAADELNPQVAEQVERVDTVALSVIENAVRMAENLHSSIKRGRNSSSALRCTNMVDDFCLGMADLNGLVLAMQAGDMSAAAKIPALLKAFKESLQYSKLLEGNKGYKKDGEKVMAGYIYETIDTLSSQFDQVCDAVRPLSEAIEVEMVRMTVRNELNTVADFKFNTDGVIKTFGKPAAVAEAAPFNKEETTWFESEAVPTSAPTQARKGFLSRDMSTLGDLANSVKRTLRRAALAGAILSAGCVEEAPAPAPAPMTFPSIPSVAAPAPAVPVETWTITDTSSVWKAVDSAWEVRCPSLSPAERTKKTGPIVHTILENETPRLTTVITTQEDKDTAGEWLEKVVTDEARYGNAIPEDYPGVLADKGATRIAGAHGLSADTIRASTLAGMPAYNSVDCTM